MELACSDLVKAKFLLSLWPDNNKVENKTAQNFNIHKASFFFLLKFFLKIILIKSPIKLMLIYLTIYDYIIIIMLISIYQLFINHSFIQWFARFCIQSNPIYSSIHLQVLESLPGIESLTDYTFKYGRNPMLELPLAVNPTGCAR